MRQSHKAVAVRLLTQNGMKKTVFLFLLIVALLGRSPHLAFALDFYSQPVSSTFWDMDEHVVSGGWGLGTGITGDFSAGLQLEIAVENQHVVPPTDFIWDLQECPDNTYTACTNVVTFTTTIDSQFDKEFLQDFQNVFGAITEFDPAKYYHLEKAGNQFNDDRIFGTAGFEIYIVLSSPFSSTNSTITNVYPLLVDSPTPSTTVDWEFDYYNACVEGYDVAGVEIQDVTNGFDYAPVEQDITSCGGDTYTHTFNFPSGASLLYRNYLRDTSTTTPSPKLYGSLVGLVNIVSGNPNITPYLSTSTTASTTAFFDFINVPYLLQSRKPFSYIYQISVLLSDVGSTTADTAGSVAYDFGTYASGTPLASIGSVTLFSTSTVTHFLSPTLLALFRGFLVAVLYISAGMFIFHDVRNIKL